MRQSINSATRSNYGPLYHQDETGRPLRPYWGQLRRDPEAPIARECDTASYGLSYTFAGAPFQDSHRCKLTACQTATRVARVLRVKVRLWEIGPAGVDGLASVRCLAEIRPI